MPQEAKYSIEEIDRMRDLIDRIYRPSGCYNAAEQKAEIENRLRTFMQNGTAVAELEEKYEKVRQAEIERAKEYKKRHLEQIAQLPRSRVLRTKEDVLDEWFQTSVANYKGATTTARDLYDGVTGHTLKGFANRNAPDGVNISQRDMERFLDAKGIKSRTAMFDKRYDGIQVIMYGNVRSGNYGT